MNQIFERFLNVLYPRCCPVCHKVLKDQDRLICERCEKKIRPIGQPRCCKCGKPVQEMQEYCTDCAGHPHIYEQGRGIFLYDDRMSQSVTRYKYYGCREYGEFYARAMYVYAGRDLQRWKPDLIVSVPLHKSKKRMRGFDQAGLLAEKLGEYTGLPVEGDLVKKIKKTRSQKKLSAFERRRNLEAAFEVTGTLNGEKILIIDDVYTTGSTVDAMAQCLKKKGAGKVYFLTVCIGRR